jgi:hypothetical protein
MLTERSTFFKDEGLFVPMQQQKSRFTTKVIGDPAGIESALAEMTFVPAWVVC